jgi:pimeloyl-ACP methyl ester carboxylesterase
MTSTSAIYEERNVMASHVFKSDQAANAVLDRYKDYLRHWPVPNEQLYVQTREGNTFVVASGPRDPPPVVLLHGTMANAAMWIREVVSWASEFRVYAVDIIGDAGSSAPSRPPLASDAHALWLSDALDGLDVRRASVIGTSLGGGLALDFAIRVPQRVDSLVLICPARVADKSIVWWALPLLLLGSWGARKVSERIVGRLPKVATEEARRFVEFADSIFKGMKPRTESAPSVTDEQLAQLSVPALVLVGAKDVTMDSVLIKRRFEQHAQDAEVLLFPNARHYLGDQSHTISEFLRRVHRGTTSA